MTVEAAEKAEEKAVIDVYGSLLELDPGDSLYLGSHDYEPYESKLVMGLLRPGDVAVDVGAMIGYYTVIFARYVGPSGRVLAFEPDPENHRLLTSNVAMNSYDHVVCHCAAVGAARGQATLWRAPANRGDNHLFPTPGRSTVEVEVFALDDAVVGAADLVKVDVQGYEGQVLAGMRSLIDRSPELALLIEFCPALLIAAGTEPASFVGDLRDHGFALFEVDGDARRVRGLDAEDLLRRVRPEFGDAREGYTNLLCVKAKR